MSETLEKPKAIGRPSTYTEAAGVKIIELHSNGVSLYDICRLYDWAPSQPSVIFTWEDRFPAFQIGMALARKHHADALAAKTLTILDSERDPQRARVAIQAHQWMAGKLDSRRFGDKVQLEVDHKVSLVDAIEQARQRVLPMSDQRTDTDDDVIDATYELVGTTHDETSCAEDLPDFFD